MYIVISGGGKVGSYLASVLLKSGNDVAIIEEQVDIADELSVTLEGRYLVICGDGCDSRSQEEAGIRRADVFVAATGGDDSNLVASEVAMRVFEVPRVVARVNNPKNLRIFRKVGIECVSSTAYIANLIEEEALMGSMSVASSLIRENMTLTEISIPHMRHHSNERGIRVADIRLPKDALIVAVSGDDNVRVAKDRSILYPGDSAIVIADNDALDEVRTILKGL